ncbi:hypothetical protein [Chryseobacterium lathyri]|nr:hypothetical protein [Chryseobacterium lathyri]
MINFKITAVNRFNQNNMNFIEHVTVWAKGDALQGKWMMGISLLVVVPVLFSLIKNGNYLQKGMILPLGLLVVLNLAYGGFLLSSKPKYPAEMEKLYHQNPSLTFKQEYEKVKGFDKSYTLTKYLWTALLTLSILGYFGFSQEYFQGLFIGFALMFFGLLIVDVFLHSRLKLYLEALSQSNLLG